MAVALQISERIETTDPDLLGMKRLLRETLSFQAFVNSSSADSAERRIFYFDADQDDPQGLPDSFATIFRAAGHRTDISDLSRKTQTTPSMVVLFSRDVRGQEDRSLQNTLVGLDNDVRAIMDECFKTSGLGVDRWEMASYSLDPEYPVAVSFSEKVTNDAAVHAVNVDGGIHR